MAARRLNSSLRMYCLFLHFLSPAYPVPQSLQRARGVFTPFPQPVQGNVPPPLASRALCALQCSPRQLFPHTSTVTNSSQGQVFVPFIVMPWYTLSMGTFKCCIYVCTWPASHRPPGQPPAPVLETPPPAPCSRSSRKPPPAPRQHHVIPGPPSRWPPASPHPGDPPASPAQPVPTEPPASHPAYIRFCQLCMYVKSAPSPLGVLRYPSTQPQGLGAGSLHGLISGWPKTIISYTTQK